LIAEDESYFAGIFSVKDELEYWKARQASGDKVRFALRAFEGVQLLSDVSLFLSLALCKTNKRHC
jgi:hypothetical protein